MATPLLSTKLYIPPVRPDLVSRPRLIERLNAGLHRKLTLISAPAGFGKTTLLSEWTHQTAVPVAWVSLDKADNDSTRFWAYFIAALQRVHESVGESVLVALQSPQPPPIEALLPSLVNDIAAAGPDPFVAVLDDFHLITDRQVHDGLTFLLDNLPPQIHLLLSGRTDPLLPLSRLRGHGELTELRTAELRFTPDEAAAFLNQVMGLGLSADDVAALEARTEGWIVGLQMAAISMQGRDPERLARFIAAFTGSHRYILDYLTDEVLLQQPESVQTFLLQTAILDRFTGPLCDAVMDSNDSQGVLLRLEQANLFLVPLDDERRWYRYHHLFTDLLRNRLQQTQAAQVPILHRRASQWYETNGWIAEAVGHALAGGDVETVARLVEGNALAMLDHGELTTLVRWLEALPDEVVRSRPWLCVAHAWTLTYAGQVAAAELLLQDAERALLVPDEAARADIEGPVLAAGQREGVSAVEAQRIAGHIAAIRAHVLGTRGDASCAAELAGEALELLPHGDLTARGWAAYHLGFMLRMSGDLNAAAQAFAEAIAISRSAGNSHVSMLVLSEVAVLQLLRGQLHKAAATCRDALGLADKHAGPGGRRLPVIGHAFIRMSDVLREWNDLQAALRHAREGLELCRQWEQADGMLEGYIHLARTLQAAGDDGGALNAIREAIQVASSVSPWFVVYTEAHQARVWLAQGSVALASRWAQESGLSVDDDLSFQHLFRYIVLARVLIAQGALDKALELLARLLKMAEGAGAISQVIEILVLQAVALSEIPARGQAQGGVEQSLTALERALSLAEPEGYMRVFLDEGAPMGKLLRDAAALGIAVDYVGRLLAAVDVETKAEGPLGVTTALPSSLVEPLTERELDVLRLLIAGLSNREIAEELYLSINTIKTHNKSIYGKLNVRSRTQAMNRAKELGLL
jgi:LuxR family maltose regulon positive regulatory protein